jgi:hypothetical protein
MTKSNIDRLNSTLDFDWPSGLFPGISMPAVRSAIIKKLKNHYTYADQVELSKAMSLGGTRILKRSGTTQLRHVKRLALMIHQVLGYHTFQETDMLKRTILDMNEQQALLVAGALIQRSLNFILHKKTWANEIPIRFGGRLVHYYSQGEDPRLGEMDITENGWCLGMSVQWLASKAARLDFWGPHDSPEAARSYRFVMAGQKLRTAKFAGSNTSDRASFRLKRFGLSKESTTTESSSPTAGSLARNIATSSASYCRIGQYYVSGGGHAMAAYVDAGSVKFMDPNLGEFAFDNHFQFQQWFPLFTRFMGYVFKRHYVEHFRMNQVKIDPQLVDAMRSRRAMLGYDD